MRLVLRNLFARFSGPGLSGQLLRAVSGGLGISVLALFVTLLSSVVLARILGAHDYGLYVFLLSATALLAMPVQMGVPLLVMRETASAEVSNDWVALHSIRSWALRMNLILGGIVALAILAYAWANGDSFDGPTRQGYWLAAALIVPVAIAGTLGGALRGLRRV
ncbi:MAG: hypothetical protein EON59_12820, partial [Alphaproteobacteria bacterium]